jgi:hypothetical protein
MPKTAQKHGFPYLFLDPASEWFITVKFLLIFCEMQAVSYFAVMVYSITTKVQNYFKKSQIDKQQHPAIHTKEE